MTLTLGYLPDMFLVDFDDLRASVKQHEQQQQHQQQHQQQRQRQRRQEELARVATDRTSALSSGAAPAATATGGAPVQGSAAGVLLAAGVDAQQRQEKEVEGTEEEVRRCTTSLEHLRLQCRSVAGADGRGACSSPSNELARIGTDRTSGSPSGPVAAAAATGGAPVQGAATVFLAAGGGAQQQQQQQVEGTEEELRRCTTGLKHLRLQCGSGGGADGRGACSSPAGDPTAKRTRMW